jgi:hypothetical protein
MYLFQTLNTMVLEYIGFTKPSWQTEAYMEHVFLLILSMHGFFTVFLNLEDLKYPFPLVQMQGPGS